MTREEAIIELKKKITCTIGGLSKDEYNATVMAIEALSADTIPIEKYHELQHQFVMLGATFADLTEVVRCKDCRYRNQTKVNEKGFEVCTASGMDITDNDFCSFGERKE